MLRGECMEIGDILYITFQTSLDKDHKQFRSKVMDIHKDYLVVDEPTHKQTFHPKFISKNKTFYVFYYKNNGIYRFKSQLVDWVKKPFPKLMIKRPPEDKHEIVQRREYVRVETAVDVAVHCAYQSFSPFTTITHDISGGGISVITDQQVFERQLPVHVNIVLPMYSGEYYYLFSKTQFLRYKQIDRDGVQAAALKFTAISNRDRQQVVQYCFEQLRQQRKEEVIFLDK